MAAAYQIS